MCSVSSVLACRDTGETATTSPLSHLQQQLQGEHEEKTVHEHTENAWHSIDNKEPEMYPRSLIRNFGPSHKELSAELPNLDARKTKTSRQATPQHTAVLRSVTTYDEVEPTLLLWVFKAPPAQSLGFSCAFSRTRA